MVSGYGDHTGYYIRGDEMVLTWDKALEIAREKRDEGVTREEFEDMIPGIADEYVDLRLSDLLEWYLGAPDARLAYADDCLKMEKWEPVSEILQFGQSMANEEMLHAAMLHVYGG